MNSSVIVCYVLLGIGLLPLHMASENLLLLTNTLRTRERGACDGEQVSLRCPNGTSISIQVAQYGTSLPETCTLHDYEATPLENITCSWPNSMQVSDVADSSAQACSPLAQYSLLQTVVEECQKKRRCTFATGPAGAGRDPCPDVRKFVEVAYKCRPTEFESDEACQGEAVHLGCPPYMRLAIYAADYGWTKYDTVQCPHKEGFYNDTCLYQFATEAAMHACHGKRRCVLPTTGSVFPNPCQPPSRAYLKVVHTCVALGVLREQYEEARDVDEIMSPYPPSPEQDFYGESGLTIELGTHLDLTSFVAGVNNQEDHGQRFVGSPPFFPMQELPPTPRTFTENPQTIDQGSIRLISNSKTYLYIIIGVSISIIILFSCVAIIYVKKKAKQSKPDMYTTAEVPNGFNDSISDIDADISHIPESSTLSTCQDVPFRTLQGIKSISFDMPVSNMYGSLDYTANLRSDYPEYGSSVPAVNYNRNSVQGYANAMPNYDNPGQRYDAGNVKSPNYPMAKSPDYAYMRANQFQQNPVPGTGLPTDAALESLNRAQYRTMPRGMSEDSGTDASRANRRSQNRSADIVMSPNDLRIMSPNNFYA